MHRVFTGFTGIYRGSTERFTGLIGVYGGCKGLSPVLRGMQTGSYQFEGIHGDVLPVLLGFRGNAQGVLLGMTGDADGLLPVCFFPKGSMSVLPVLLGFTGDA